MERRYREPGRQATHSVPDALRTKGIEPSLRRNEHRELELDFGRHDTQDLPKLPDHRHKVFKAGGLDPIPIRAGTERALNVNGLVRVAEDDCGQAP